MVMFVSVIVNLVNLGCSVSCILSNVSFIFLLLQAMVIINGFLYVFGGTTGYIYSTDLHRLDLTTREWIHLKPNNPPDDLPEERYAAALLKKKQKPIGTKLQPSLQCIKFWLAVVCVSQIQAWNSTWRTKDLYSGRRNVLDIIPSG